MSSATKVCKLCYKRLDVSEFYAFPKSPDGLGYKCKECAKLAARNNYAKNRDRYAQYERERFQRPERKALCIKYQQKRRQRSPEKYQARTAVQNALRDGLLVKGACAVCGSVETEAHHTDYAKPLEVIWLCRQHHLDQHCKTAYSTKEEK